MSIFSTLAKGVDEKGNPVHSIVRRDVWDCVPLGAVPPWTDAQYQCDGQTPLYDAAAQVLTKLEEKGNCNQFVVIITDGEDNASKVFRGPDKSGPNDERREFGEFLRAYRQAHRERCGPTAISEMECYFIGTPNSYCDKLRSLGIPTHVGTGVSPAAHDEEEEENEEEEASDGDDDDEHRPRDGMEWIEYGMGGGYWRAITTHGAM
jgi:hypothetical protein